jgi:tetratricopeptide (TPR) repeat protein
VQDRQVRDHGHVQERRDDFGAELRRRRESAGLSLTALARATHFTKGYLSKVENGRVRSNHRLAQLCDRALGANGELLALTDHTTQPLRRTAGGLMGLPDVTRHFVGRHVELARLVEVLRGPDTVRVCVVDGMAGVGKTALALAAAHAAEQDFPDGCLFFDLRGYTPGVSELSGAETLDRLLRVLGISGERIPPDVDGRTNLYQDRLRGRRMLLVFDNVRSARQIWSLIPAEPRCRVLITSRQRLNALDEAAHVSTGALSTAEAIVLFQSIACNRIPTDESAIPEIVGHCGRLPLAIRIAAARLLCDAGWTVEEFRDRLAHEATRLAALDDGERSVAAAFRLSYEHLPTDQRRLFGLLAVHPGHEAEVGGVAALGGLDQSQTDRLLDRLHDARLLTRRPGGYIELHDLMRTFAATHALAEIEPSDRHAAARRLVEHALSRTHAADTMIEPYRFRPDISATNQPALDFHDRNGALTWLRAQWPTLVEFGELAAAEEMHEHCWQLAFLLRGFFFREKLSTPWIRTHRTALTSTQAIDDRNAMAITLNNLGMAYLDGGNLDDAAECHRQALVSFTELGNEYGATDARSNLAWTHLYLGDSEAALQELGTALETYRRSGRTRNEIIGLLAVSSGFGDQVDVVPAWRVDGGVIVSLAA